MPDVQVINRNRMRLIGRFDGNSYEFPPGQPVSIPEKAAEHIFGMTETNKTGALNRLGLLMPHDPKRTLEEALKALNNISFSQGRTVFDDAGPLPPSQPIGESYDTPQSPGGESEAEKLSAAEALSEEQRVAQAREYLSKRPPRKTIGG